MGPVGFRGLNGTELQKHEYERTVPSHTLFDMGAMRFIFLACTLVLASFAAAQNDDSSQDEKESFSFDFFAMPWSTPIRQPQRLSVIANLNSTVQGMQDDPLKLGAILLQSIIYNQTEVSTRHTLSVHCWHGWRLLCALDMHLGSDKDLGKQCQRWPRLFVGLTQHTEGE